MPRAGAMERVRGVHRRVVADRRTRVLAGHLAALLPEGATLLDVGCGDGAVTRALADRAGWVAEGIDVFVRPATCVPVRPFDGHRIPHPDRSFDAVVFVDVLHHTPDPTELLREARRVARRAVLVKDHLADAPLARATLRFMDRAGNPAEGVPFPENYWTRAQWDAAFAALGLRVEAWRDRLRLYSLPADWVFGRGLHFAARLGMV
jgi:ubiquinone/menaquinone biosynthesis C-methylase UbiE